MRKLTPLVPVLILFTLLGLAGAGCTAKVKASYHLKRADRYYDAGQVEPAEIEYKNVLRNNPQNVRAWSRLGYIYFDQGRLGEAAQLLSRAGQLSPTNLEVRVILGKICLQTGELKDAWAEAGFILDKNPRDADAPILLAEAAATNQIAEARLRLQKLSPPGGTAPLQTALGVLSFRQGDLKTAAADFSRAVTLDPKFAEAYTSLGNLHFAQNDLKPADQAFKSAADLAPPRSGKRLQYAEFKILTGDSAAGKQLLTDLVKQTPDYLPGWMALAQLAAAEKNYPEGLALLGNVLSRDPQNLEGLLLKGRLDMESGATDQAINDFTGMTRMFPKMPVVFYQLALARLANNETDAAIGNLNQALNLNPKYVEAIQKLAEIEIRNGKVTTAIEALQALTWQLPRLKSAQLLLAEAYRAQGNPNAALRIYHALETDSPKDPQLHLLLGDTLLQQKDDPGARLEFDRALELSPDYLPALEQVVHLDLQDKQYDAAQLRLQQQIGTNPKSVALQLLLADVQIARGATNQAEATLLKTITMQPASPEPYLLLAQLYLAAHEDQSAVAQLQTTLDREPKDPGALMLLGMACTDAQKYPEAGAAYEKLLALTPNNRLALNNLACLYADHLGRLDQGAVLARRARDLAPTDPAIADTLGWILTRKGEYSSALDLLRESAAKLASVPEVQYHLGVTYYRLDDATGARTAFEHALQLTGDFPDQNECRQCLAVLAVDVNTAGADLTAWLEKRVARQPDDSEALVRLAAIYQRTGKNDQAISTYQAVLQAAPQNVSALLNLARLETSRNPAAAFDLAKRAAKLTPNDPEVNHTLGRLAFLTGDQSWAVNLLESTARVQPQNPELLYDLAEAFYSVGRVADARVTMQNALQTGAAFARANDARRFLAMVDPACQPAPAAQSQAAEILKTMPDYVPALMVKALLAEQKPDPADAEAAYAEVLKLYPDFTPAQKQLALLYVRQTDHNDQAYALALKARKALPADPDLAKVLGMVLCRQGDFARAAYLLQESVRQRSRDAELLYYLGLTQYHLKNRKDSKIYFQQALDLNLSGNQAVDARQKLVELK